MKGRNRGGTAHERRLARIEEHFRLPYLMQYSFGLENDDNGETLTVSIQFGNKQPIITPLDLERQWSTGDNNNATLSYAWNSHATEATVLR